MIDEYAGELVADGLVDQHRRHRTIDPAREAADHLGVADLVADARDRLGPVSAHGPVTTEPGQPHEVFV